MDHSNNPFSDPPSAERAQRAAWGNNLADAIDTTSNVHNISHHLRTNGIDINPFPLINDLQFNIQAPSVQILLSMLQSLDIHVAMLHSRNNVGLEHTRHLEASLQETQVELEKHQFALSNNQALAQSLTNLSLGAQSTHTPRRQTGDPSRFTGATEDIKKRQEEYNQWKKLIALTFIKDKLHYPKDSDEVIHIIGLLDGDAAKNNAAHITAIINFLKDTDTEKLVEIPRWCSSEAIFKDLDAQYITIDMKRADALEYDKLNMTVTDKTTGRTTITPYPQFLAQFNSLAISAGKTAEQKVEDFLKKVSKAIAQKFSNMDRRPGADDFAAWSAKGQQFWENQLQYEHNHGSQKKGPNHQNHQNNQTNNQQRQNNNQHHNNPAHTTASGGDVMDLDHMQLSRMMSPQEKDHCIQNGLCFYCKDPDHSIGFCEKKRLADVRFARGGGSQRGGRGGYSISGGRGGHSNNGGRGGRGGYNNGGHLRSMESSANGPNYGFQGFPSPAPGWTPQGYVPSSYNSNYASSAYGAPPPTPQYQTFEHQNAAFHHHEFPRPDLQQGKD